MFLNQELMNFVSAMKNQPVLVVGDIMLDRFVYGSVERISPEGPIPVLSIEREDAMLGGAGNALANLAGLGARGYALSVIGDDENGARVREAAEALGVNTDGLLVDPARPTIIKTRYLAGHQQLLRTDFESRKAVSPQVQEALLKKAKELVKQVRVVILSDYGKGLLSKDVIAQIIKLARAEKLPVIVDPKGQDFSIYKGASAVTPNRKELSEATKGAAVDSDEAVIAAAKSVIKDCGIEAVVATRSADGISVITNKSEPAHFRTEDIEVFDVSGAGDTVIATIAAALAAGANLQQAAALANIAGSIVVTKVGTAPIRASELAEHLSEHKGRQAAFLSAEEAAEQVKRWKARGLTVGFTNGCFDILHHGHVSYLAQARGACDRLIVGLNTDVSVRLLKGKDRPVNNEVSRASVLGALASVDTVVLFGADRTAGDNTAGALIKMLRPDLYFKGGDYTIEQIPEAAAVEACGGKVQIMQAQDGHSTTNILKKMKTEAA